MASEGQGAPRSRQSGAAEGHSATGRHLASSLRARRRDRRPTAPGCSDCSTPRTSISAPATPTSATPAAAQRERQFAAFKAAVDLAIAREGRPLPHRRRPVRLQHPAAPLGRAGRAPSSPRLVAGEDPDASSSPAPTTVYDRASIYRAYDLAALAGSARPTTTSSRSSRRTSPSVHLPMLRRRRSTATVFATKRAPYSPLRDLHVDAATEPRATWHIGIVHGALAIPDRTDRDEVVVTKRGDRGERPRLPRARPLALDPAGQGRRRRPTPTRARRSPSPSTRTAPARSSLVELDDAAGGKTRHGRGARRSGGRRSRSSTSTRRALATSRTSSRSSRRRPTPTSSSTPA